MSFNNVEHFRQFLDEVDFEQQINDLKQSVWNEWIEQHLGEADLDNGLGDDADLTESYKSVYNKLNDAMLWNVVDSADRWYMEKFREDIKTHYKFEDVLDRISMLEWNARNKGNEEKHKLYVQLHHSLASGKIDYEKAEQILQTIK
jgi:thioredoxin-related protein